MSQDSRLGTSSVICEKQKTKIVKNVSRSTLSEV